MPYDKPSILQKTGITTRIEDVNYLSPLGFGLTIDNLKFKNVSFMVQRASIPDLSVNFAEIPFSKVNLPLTPDKATYAPLDLQFIIDENLINYEEIHDWLHSQIMDPESVKKTRDITLHILSSHNNVVRNIQFVDAFPISLSSLEFDVTQSDVEYLSATVSFKYSYYKILPR